MENATEQHGAEFWQEKEPNRGWARGVAAVQHRERKDVLFYKKEPKNFHPLGKRLNTKQTDESLFASFSTEKEDSCLLQ
jgi:hypothetical protein